MAKKRMCEKGMVTPIILVVLSVFFVIAVSIMNWSLTEKKNVVLKERNTEALQVAEAGVNYYKWLLAHNETDFKNGETWCCNNDDFSTPESCGGVCGPYTEIYKDYSGNTVGEFELTITPPPIGSTIMQVQSVGKTAADPDVQKTVIARLGKRSLARYSFLSNSPIWIGEDENTSGPIHSNSGIRFDGDCNSEVTSAVSSYNAGAANHGVSGTRPGIWGSADSSCSQYWDFPEPTIDFNLFTVDMAGIKTGALSQGIYLPESGANGYKIVFRSDAMIDIYTVTSTTQNVWYYNDSGTLVRDAEGVNHTDLFGTYDMPTNGLIFAQDSVWVEGTVNGRATVAASRFTSDSSNYARIVINGNINYTAHDGSDVLGLMAEGDILVPRHAPVPLNIDAVMLSQKGHVYVRNYKSSYKMIKDGSITVYGGIISNLFWTWSYVDSHGVVDGYKNTYTNYDNHLTYGPPPSFPTEANFNVISWTEQ